MSKENVKQVIWEAKELAQKWNKLYREQKFDNMTLLATEDIGIANAQDSLSVSGLIFG